MIRNYTEEKVHNEIELCTVSDMEAKAKIERALLKEGISFYIRWEEQGFFAKLFSKKEESCIICVNSMRVAEAEECIRILEKTEGIQTEFIMRRVHKLFF